MGLPSRWCQHRSRSNMLFFNLITMLLASWRISALTTSLRQSTATTNWQHISTIRRPLISTTTTSRPYHNRGGVKKRSTNSSTIIGINHNNNLWMVANNNNNNSAGGTHENLNVKDAGGYKNNVGDKLRNVFRTASNKFKSRPGTYLLIPLVAAVVGWFTNYLAVKMLFYPVNFLGLPIYRVPEQPLGLLGWQGIVPCKSREMGEAMVHMVTTELLSVEEVFKRLDPKAVADILAPEVPKLGNSILQDLFPSWIVSIPTAVFSGFSSKTRDVLAHWNHRFLMDFTIDMQNNIGKLLNVKNCVVEQFLADRTLLGGVFQSVGHVEFDFLINSGLWFGFLLGLIQMVVALFWENPWSLSIGGGIVGLATNWLALKWVFEPVNPTKVGPFILQGLFIKRQQAVAAEFGDFFTKSVLTSEKLWHSIMNDPSTAPHFNTLFTKHLTKFANLASGSLGVRPEPEVIAMAAARAIEKLPNHLSALHPYVDKTLGLKETLRMQMGKLSCEKFERVLHPIFEEDELTLIISGAVLGFAAGLVQQGLETGAITIPTRKQIKEWACSIPTRVRATKARIVAFSPQEACINIKTRIVTFSPKEACRCFLNGARCRLATCLLFAGKIVGKKDKQHLPPPGATAVVEDMKHE